MSYAFQPQLEDVSLHVFCFSRRSREESSELTNVGALKIAETLQQSDAMTKQAVITFRCPRLFFDVARLLVERPNLGNYILDVP
jgi:hypothetical protein